MSEPEFNPWKWDRDNGRNGTARLVIQRNGHEVALDHRGVSIDGQRIIRDDPTKGGDHGFKVRSDGTVIYRDQIVASVAGLDDAGASAHAAVEAARVAVEEEQRRETEQRERQRRHTEQQQLTEPRGHRAASRDELEITR
jgi:hypothetical protein